ncbi:MAG: translational GTPase TypA [Deltaproteobacteria bacterium]|nr:translational GTPase TypA [Deltaproteobacteria bacterium]
MEFRNVAIIAHVDHGKTTLIDGLLRQCNVFMEHERVAERVMDSMDLERERGITITSKNTAVTYRGVKINIVDTPGHADFGGEVERVLQMVEGALLLVDASEGPLPQTRFVLRKAMAAGLHLIVCINKIDRPDARIAEVLQEIYDLFIDLGADDAQIEFSVLYTYAKGGIAHLELEDGSTDLRPLLDTLVEQVPPPPESPDANGPAQLLVTNLDYDPYVGRICLGRLRGGKLRRQGTATWFSADAPQRVKVQLLYTWDGLKRVEVEEAFPGDIVAIAGIDGVTVGDTLATGDDPKPLHRMRVDEPTIGMMVTINTTPFSGLEGRFLTSRQIRERLDRELLSNVSLRLEETDTREVVKLFGRGELQLAILVEQMRREGFELSLSRPEVVKKEVDGVLLEPWEYVTIDVPDEHLGTVTRLLAERKGQMMDLRSDGNGRSRVTYRAPSRGLIGFRNELLTLSRGEAVLNRVFDKWDVDVGFITRRMRGALVADRAGRATTYALYRLQPRGELFIKPGTTVYEGMIVGVHSRENDLNVDATREKHLTNIRSAGADEKQILSPPLPVTLEGAIAFIDEDEWVEVTPKSIRLRKRVLAANQRSLRRSRPR